MTMLARGIQRLAIESMNNVRIPHLLQYTQPKHTHTQIKYALQPLYDLTTRYPPTLSYLTPLHPLLLTTIVRSKHYLLSLPILNTPITTLSLALSPDLTYNDHLVYHYTGGVIWGVLKRWDEAEEFFESVVCAPGQGVVGSALQLEALKKWVLVQLISKGKVRSFLFFLYPGGGFFSITDLCICRRRPHRNIQTPFCYGYSNKRLITVL